MTTLSGFKDLHDYLAALASQLRQRGLNELSTAGDHARHCSASNTSTELLGEARIVLRRVASEEQGALTPQQRSNPTDIVKQIDSALNQSLRHPNPAATARSGG